MTDDTWLRDALRATVAAQPIQADRTSGAFARAAHRRRQRTVAVSCVAAFGVVVAAAFVHGAQGTDGLRPVEPLGSPTSTATALLDAATAGPTPSLRSGSAPGDVVAVPASSPATVASAGPAATAHPKLDVYVLLDATVSMVSARNAVHGAIVDIDRSLRKRHVDLRWGFGAFGDWGAVTEPNPFAYWRISAIGGPRPDVRTVRYEGGGDEPEADTFGLEGSVGISHLPYTQDGQEAGFRADAHKVVLLVTDAFMHQGGSAPAYPTIHEAAMELRSRGVTVVALQVVHEGSHADWAERDLRLVTRGTGGLAKSAVDCDGDNRADIRRGQPLVCRVTEKGSHQYAGVGAALAAMIG